MEQPKFQLEAGKFYRTDEGYKAYVLGKDHPFDKQGGEFKFYAAIEQRGINSIFWFNEAGEPVDGDIHLVAEWVEPKRIKGWIAVGENVCGSLLPSRDKAIQDYKNCYGGALLACIEIDVLEGQGLEGGQ